jgi:hypothetical protein
VHFEKKIIRVVGRVEQKLVNVDNEYKTFFSRLNGNTLENFTLSKTNVGLVAWNDPVEFAHLDFQGDEIFRIGETEIECSLPELQGPCRVTFYHLPSDIAEDARKLGFKQAKEKLRARAEKYGNGIEFGDMWENGSWCLRFTRGLA